MTETNLISNDLLYTLLVSLAIILIVSLILLAWIIARVRRINLPANADFFTALRATPFSVVLLLDLLDLGLDFLSAPIAWVLLSRLGLQPLRAVSVVESVIPGTQFLPTMTISWIVARLVRSR